EGFGRRPDSRRVEAEAPVQLASPTHSADLTRLCDLDRPRDLQLEVVAGGCDLELIQLEHIRLDVDVEADLQHRYSRWSKKSGRSEERRVGKECRSRWSPHH